MSHFGPSQQFTDESRKVISRAEREAEELGSPQVEPVHVLLGLVYEEGEMLGSLGIAAKALCKLVEPYLGSMPKVNRNPPPLTTGTRSILAFTKHEAGKIGSSSVGPAHIVLGILSEGKSLAAQILSEVGLTLRSARAAVVTIQIEDQFQMALQQSRKVREAAEELLSDDDVRSAGACADATLERLSAQIAELSQQREALSDALDVVIEVIGQLRQAREALQETHVL